MVKRYGLLCGLLLLTLGLGCRNNETPTPVNSAPPPVQPNPSAPSKAASPTESQSPLKDALEQRLAQASLKGSHSAIPAGTRLLSVNLEDGVATIDVSKEFNALANRGESTESRAQKELRALLAQFSTVKKMRLTVEGKPFDSQATDWNTPFPVRDSDQPNQSDATSETDRSSR